MQDAINLEAAFAQETEQKSPTTPTTEPTIASANQAFWGDQSNPDDFEAKVTPISPDINKVATPIEPEKPKITAEAARNSAKVAVGMLDITQSGLFSVMLKRKFRKKYSQKELDWLENNPGKTESDDETERKIIEKHQKLELRLTKKMDAIPFKKDEEEQLVGSIAMYFKEKQIELPPSYLLVFAVVDVIGTRAISVMSE